MSIEVTRRVWQRSGAGGTELLLLLALAEHADGEGIAWPSVAALAERCRIGERHARRVIGRLVEAGELEVLREGGGRGNRTRYRVAVADRDGTARGAGGPALAGEEEGAAVQLSGKKGGGAVLLSRGKGGAGTPLSREEGGSAGPLCGAEKGVYGSEKGGLQVRAYKGVNRQEPSPEIEGESIPSLSPGEVPEGVRALDAELRHCRGYEPTEAFYRKVLEKYAGRLDLEEQGMRIRGWFADRRHRKRVCSCGFVLGWLADEVDPGRRARRREGAARRGERAAGRSGSGRVEVASGLEKYG
jgi:hypothetical protein